MPKIDRTPKPVSSFRLSFRTRRHVEEMAKDLEWSEAQVVEFAVECMYAKQRELKMSQLLDDTLTQTGTTIGDWAGIGGGQPEIFERLDKFNTEHKTGWSTTEISDRTQSIWGKALEANTEGQHERETVN